MEYRIGPREILMGWLNVRTGDQRQWRCSSPRHMLLDDEDRPAHDPYENIPDFMRCVDKVVSYGFPARETRGTPDSSTSTTVRTTEQKSWSTMRQVTSPRSSHR
jgi:hypothetical protein